MTLDRAFEQARVLEFVEMHAASYIGNSVAGPSFTMIDHNFSEVLPTSSAFTSRSQFFPEIICIQGFAGHVQAKMQFAENVAKKDITN